MLTCEIMGAGRWVGACLAAMLLPAALWGSVRAPGAGRQGAEDSAALLEEAVRRHQAGDYVAAIKGYERFLAQFPNVGDVRSNLGAALVAVGEYSRAIEEYEQAVKSGNCRDVPAVRFNLALAYYKMAEFSQAAAELEEVLAARPDDLRAALLLGDCWMRQGEYDKIVRLLTPFEARYPDDMALTYLLGTALIRTGEVEKGSLLVDRILRKGDSAEAHLMLGTAYLMGGDITSAVEEFRKAVELNPNLPSVNGLFAKALRDSGRLDEAIPYFRKELEVNPFDYNANLYLGVYLYNREQRYEEALEHFARALKVRPGDLAVRFQIALVYILQNRVDEALPIVEDIVKQVPDFQEGHVTLARLYFRLRRTEEAQHHREIAERLRQEKESRAVKEMPTGSVEQP